MLFCDRECELAHQKDPHHEMLHVLEAKGFSLNLTFIAQVYLKMFDTFGSVNELRKFVESHRDKRYTVFDFDWSEDLMNFKNIFLCILGIQYDEEEIKKQVRQLTGSDNLTKWLIKELKLNAAKTATLLGDSSEDRDFIEGILLKILNARKTLSWVSGSGGESNENEDRLPGYYFHPAKAMLNYSCDTNIYQYYENRKRIVWIITQPVKKDGQLFVENNHPYYSHGRFMDGCPQKKTCVPCLRGWAKDVNPDEVLMGMKRTIHNDIKKFTNYAKKYEGGIRLFKKICRDINQNYDNYENDSNVRRDIAAKIIASGSVLEMMRDPFFPLM